MLGHIVKRNAEIESAGIRLKSGHLIYQIGDHNNKWGDYDGNKSEATHLIVPILQSNQPWGDIELKFLPLRTESATVFYLQPIFKMGGFILVIGFFTYLVFMLKALKVLDPSAVIPDRVNAAFDTLSESIVIVDENEQILLANKAFTERLAQPINLLLGKKLSSLSWQNTADSTPILNKNLPWQKVLKTGKSFIGNPLNLATANNNLFKFVINSSPIQNNKSVTQGVLITLDDVTELEKNYSELQETVTHLQESKLLIEQKNKELDFLATRDPLTGCLNRRAFNELFIKAFNDANKNNTHLCFIMADIDYFKKVNDNFGHATGDVVIQLFAEILLANTRKVDIVGRYGGEEFSIALPGLTETEAFMVAERIRLRLKDESINRFENGPRVTASLGIASLGNNPSTPDDLQKYADEALYDAKESGRNRVNHWQPKALAKHSTSPDKLAENLATDDTNKTADSKAQLELRVAELENIASQFSAELEYTKHYDTVTGLPNHILFYDRINQTIERGGRHDKLAAILLIDVGLLGQVNTTFGRNFGDKMLAEIAERIKNSFRKYDAISRLTISRFGGDEFAVLLNDLGSKEDLTWITMRLQRALSEPLNIEGHSIFITNHIGISLYPSDAENTEELIKNALLAKKHSKQHFSDNHYQFFDEDMHKLSLKQVNLDKELRESILNENWLLLYQPKLDIKTNVIVGVEALIRWKHPIRGILSPYEFIEFAEQRGLISAIGDWVIKTACIQIQSWITQGIDCKISVNVSAMQLKEEDFSGRLIRTLIAHGIPPRQFELELTESTLMNNFDIALPCLKRLNSSGIKIAIDDFGTGYSSLGYLKNLPISILKIDRIFIKDICNDANDKQIVQALINMAHSLNMKVIAEGVEETDQLELLKAYNCDEIQGYLLSKPITSEEITVMLSKPSHLKIN
jgi:diguanylate cyclase (GGDEF)-like protein